jgi:hypothetical protein
MDNLRDSRYLKEFLAMDIHMHQRSFPLQLKKQ